jgi:hypothetical protein
MKNEILDDIFNDNLRDQLVKGEIIVWEGKPRFSNYSRLVASFFIISPFGFLFYTSIIHKDYWLTLFFGLGITYSLFDIFLQKRKTRYLVTNQRIIFQLPKMRKVEIHSLPLNQLEEVVVKEKVNKNGTLEFILKEPFKTKIKTTDIRNSYPRKNPTMEIIGDVLEVKRYIEKSIKGEL